MKLANSKSATHTNYKRFCTFATLARITWPTPGPSRPPLCCLRVQYHSMVLLKHDHNPRQKKERPSSSVEALSWTEYRRALSELCPAFRRHGISTCVSNKYVATTTSGRLCPEQRRTRSPSCNDRIYPAAEQCGRCREAVTEEAGMVPKLYSKEDCVDSSFRARLGRENPPRSPGADSFNVLRRKRHAAVSMDYEAATMEPPQVGNALRRDVQSAWNALSS